MAVTATQSLGSKMLKPLVPHDLPTVESGFQAI